ncbi:ATP-grasp domain-containing protein [Frondihabitans australicus]|uniref:Glutathione synthase/RimK-type ligase-like ATP-grasp enzyme n=1 Tax=Frondihabitans australicus TaxID=386892 RepID=A0A495IGJ2_9MICO|nr:alpha-L-glutamate ligase [Frondihabitans australicus]RKR75074.1 glutathione synthase/RimK-type ligase-like ATP-grasp enzyme [Frondihabitans australicus]
MTDQPSSQPTPRVYVIHENPEWFPPLQRAFDAEGVPVEEILLTDGAIDLTAEPAPGIYWSRMSASAHTRGNEHSKEYTRAVLSWLEASGRRTVGGRGVIDLEVSKVQQHVALQKAGFDVPRTSAVFGTRDLVATARSFGAPFISKHNQGGKGLGVRRWDSVDEFAAWVDGPDFESSPDGITLLQELLIAEQPFVTRAEFVGGRFVYAVRVDTSGGAFEFCPADACALPGQGPLFQLRGETRDGKPIAEHDLILRLPAFLAENGIEIAGVEFSETVDGRAVIYDINTNTNYNPDVEAASSVSGPRSIARFLGDLLEAEYGPIAQSTGAQEPKEPVHA